MGPRPTTSTLRRVSNRVARSGAVRLSDPDDDLVIRRHRRNDAGIAGAATDSLGLFLTTRRCLLGRLPEPVLTGGCKDKYAPQGGEDKLARQILEAEPKVVAALQEVHRRSPDAAC